MKYSRYANIDKECTLFEGDGLTYIWSINSPLWAYTSCVFTVQQWPRQEISSKFQPLHSVRKTL